MAHGPLVIEVPNKYLDLPVGFSFPLCSDPGHKKQSD